ncbi:N-6 DNA methylase [Kitasatospora sp. RG8]|uniref:N-6 DNA methylase n=1 Tax=Kitasatospora sp. RG8 TaxID=2820815 RepID=UPI001AE0B6D4|nr:N-6 DNA methylase [Kitasatospora sp. RG8]MBP0455560.1 N-6 DNA methylase [Kitasatospora sp. RG8]
MELVTDDSEHLISRSEIARHAGVRRPAVTNWERRHSDYPRPVRVGNDELFHAEDVANWLSRRTVPANALASDEEAETTYGDRFRRSAGLLTADDVPDSALSGRVAQALLGRPAEPWQRTGQWHTYLELLLSLVFVRGCVPDTWPSVVNDVLTTHGLGRRLSRAVTEVVGSGTEGLLARTDRPFSDAELLSLDRACRILDEVVGTVQAGDTFERLLQAETERIGKRGEQLVTPPSLRRLMVELAAQGHSPTSVYDPFCRSGELLTEFGRRQRAAAPYTARAVTPNEQHRRIAAMNLKLHGIQAHTAIDMSLPGNPHRVERHQHDLVLTNPPFSMRSPVLAPFASESWPFGAPPERNADLGWIQHAVASLTPDGRAIVVMANGAAFRGGREQAIRAGLLEAGAVEGIISLPAGLFSTTGIGVCLWILRRPGGGPPPDVLFIDAREAGEMETRTLRVLTETDVSGLAEEYRTWLSDPQAFTGGRTSRWSSRRATFTEISGADFSLDPTRFLQPADEVPDSTEIAGQLDRIRDELTRLHLRAAEVDTRISRLLNGMS